MKSIFIGASVLMLILTSFTGLAEFEKKEKISDIEMDSVSTYQSQAGEPNYFDIDLKVKKDGVEWQDSISANVGTDLEFKINVNSLYSEGHTGVFVLVELPENMFSYKSSSGSSPNQIFISNEQVVWSFIKIKKNSEKEFGFTAKLNEPWTDDVELKVFSLKPDTYENIACDSVEIEGNIGSNSFNTYSKTMDNNLKILNLGAGAQYLQNDEQIIIPTDEQNYVEENQDQGEPMGILYSTVYVNLGGIQTESEVFFGTPEDIDADNDPNTGMNGADIRVTYYFLPYIDSTDGFEIGLNFILNIAQLGSENEDKELTVNTQILGGMIKMGYYCTDEGTNLIPNFARLDFNINFRILELTRSYSTTLSTNYSPGSAEDKTIQIFGEFHGDSKDRYLTFDLNPVIETTLKIQKTNTLGKWKYSFDRNSEYPSTITSTYKTVDQGDSREVKLVLNEIPTFIEFDLLLTPLSAGGGEIYYEADEMYDIDLFIDSLLSGDCRYITIQNMPNLIHAKWTPNIIHGNLDLQIEGTGTEILFQDDIDNPVIELKFTDLESMDLHTEWNLTNPGYFIITKSSDISFNLEVKLGNWRSKFVTRAKTDKIDIQWYIDTTGYYFIDTDWQEISEIEVLIKGPNIGLSTVSDYFKTEDFEIQWTVWPPAEWNIELFGEVDFFDTTVDIFLNGNWYHLWPWI